MNLSEQYAAKLKLQLTKLSNGEMLPYDDQWIEDAGEMFKASLRKQLTEREKGFRIRMSNLGRPVCQLQREKAGEEKEVMPYNHIVRMMLGDAVECIMEVLLRVAGLNITGGKEEAELEIHGEQIRGENDIEIDGRVYDTKSSSPWAFTHKWSEGWSGVAKDDAFGYAAQLWGYATGTNKPQGGWIVVNKSTGEVEVVEADPSPDQVSQLEAFISENVKVIATDRPFIKCFEPTQELFRGKPTGNKRLHTTCTFCSYRASCWPDAVYKPQGGSKAVSPRHYWYSHYEA